MNWLESSYNYLQTFVNNCNLLKIKTIFHSYIAFTAYNQYLHVINRKYNALVLS